MLDALFLSAPFVPGDVHTRRNGLDLLVSGTLLDSARHVAECLLRDGYNYRSHDQCALHLLTKSSQIYGPDVVTGGVLSITYMSQKLIIQQ